MRDKKVKRIKTSRGSGIQDLLDALFTGNAVSGGKKK